MLASEPQAGPSSSQPASGDSDFLADYAAAGPSYQPPAVLRPWFPSLDVDKIRKSLPYLQDLDDDYIRAHSYDQLVAANATLQRMEQKSASEGHQHEADSSLQRTEAQAHQSGSWMG
jgi:hypothetical protein